MSRNREFDLIGLGQLMLRLSPPSNERITRSGTLKKTVGGAELNVVSGAALLGLKTAIISKLPCNDLAVYVKNRLRFAGVSDEFIIDDDSRNSRLGVYYYEYGAHPRKPNVIYDREHTSFHSLDISEFDDSICGDTKCFHTSGITLALNPQVRRTAIEMIRKFKENGALISFDVNFRGNLWSGEEARECIEQILPFVDIFFCSEDTARLTFKKEGTAREMMKSFAAEYPISIVASTQRIVHSPKVHTFGSVIYSASDDYFYEEQPYENIEVVDRIGSGDAYVAGVLYGLLAHDGDCRKALEYGNATGAVKNTVVGDLLSSDLKEIDRIIKSHHSAGRQSEMDR